MHFIEPEDRRQVSMFTSLEDFVEGDNPVRLLDLIVEQVVKANPERFHRRGLSNVGRRAYSPQLLLKLYLYGYLNGITSSRKLEAETKRNIELMWLLGRLSPDHKTISDYRKDHGEAIHFVTLRFAEFLVDEKYITGRHVALDGTKLKANAARERFMRTGSLERRIQAIEGQLEEYLDQLKRNDVREEAEDQDEGNGDLTTALIDKVCELEEELQQLKSDCEVLEASPFKEVHRTDPDCRIMKSGSNFFPAYNLQMVTDMAFGLIIYTEIRQEPGDKGLTEEIVDHLEMATSIVPEHLYADSAYFSQQQIHWLETDRSITSWMPIQANKWERKDQKAGITFTYDPNSDTYRCSEGRILHRKQISYYQQAVTYRGKNCAGCAIKSQCTQVKNRSIKILFLKSWLDRFKERMKSIEGRAAMNKRKAWVEHPFGTLKIWMGKNPLKLRGKHKVQTEIDLYTIAYNFKRLLKIDYNEQIATKINQHNWSAP